MTIVERFAGYPGNRVIPFEGSRNFRDMGGYMTEDGRRVKYGLFFRADELSGLTEQDMEFLRTLPIKTIFDYRDDQEAEFKPDPVIKGIRYERVPASNGSFQVQQGSLEELLRAGALQEQMGLGKLEQFYAGMALNNPSYKRLMEVVQDLSGLGLLHHCTAGKDRTGVGSALILLTLGVPKAAILEDYMITNETMEGFRSYVTGKLAPYVTAEQLEVISSLLEAREEYLEAFFRAIEEKYGDVDTYLAEEFGLTREKREQLKEYCLE